jgi:hypothetical protein
MDEREAIERWVLAWKEAGPRLEADRAEQIRRTDTLRSLAVLERAFNYAVRELPPRPWSGLVEMQGWFAKLPR